MHTPSIYVKRIFQGELFEKANRTKNCEKSRS